MMAQHYANIGSASYASYFRNHGQNVRGRRPLLWGLRNTLVLAGALLQWLKLPAWKVRDRGFEPHSGFHILKNKNVSSPLTCKEFIS